MKTTFIIPFLLSCLLLLGCWDVKENPLGDDPDLQQDPVIVEILQDDNGYVRMTLNHGYSPESEIVIQRKSVGGFETYLPQRLTQTTVVDTTIDKETDAEYIYRVKVEKDGFSTEFSAERDIVYISRGLNQPEGLQLISSELQGVTLEWIDRSNKEDGYFVQKDEGGGFQEVARLVTNSTNYVDDIPGIPSPPLEIIYRIQAFSNTQTSGWIEGAITYTGINPPENMRIVDSTYSSVRIAWDDRSSIESGYVVERKLDGGAFEEVGQVPANTEEWTDLLRDVGMHVYTYRTRAIKDGQGSHYSNEALLRADIPEPLFSSDFEGSDCLGEWVIGGRQEDGANIADCVMRGGSTRGHLFKDSITEITLLPNVQNFPYSKTLTFSFEMEVKTSSTTPPANTFYGRSGVWIGFKSPSGEVLGWVGYISATTDLIFDDAANNPAYNYNRITENVNTSYALNMEDLISTIAIDESQIATVEFYFETYSSTRPMPDVEAELWIDNVSVTQ